MSVRVVCVKTLRPIICLGHEMGQCGPIGPISVALEEAQAVAIPWFREFPRLKPLPVLPSSSSLKPSPDEIMGKSEKILNFVTARFGLQFDQIWDCDSFKEVGHEPMALQFLARKFLQRPSPRQVIITRELEDLVVCSFDLVLWMRLRFRLDFVFVLVMRMKWELFVDFAIWDSAFYVLLLVKVNGSREILWRCSDEIFVGSRQRNASCSWYILFQSGVFGVACMSCESWNVYHQHSSNH